MPFIATTATKKILKLKKRIRAVQGGSSASKTISILLVLIDKAQRDKTATVTSIVSESMPHLRRGAMRDFLNIMRAHEYFDEDRWDKTNSIYTFETGSIIEFFGADSSAKVHGPRRDRLFINEANNIDYETFSQLELRTKEFIMLDWNPSNEFWFYEELLGKRDDVDHIILTYLDNEALDINIKMALEKRQHNKSWWRVYGMGLLGQLEGLIYTNWKTLEKVPHEARLIGYGLDFGYNDPSVIVGVYYWNNSYIVDEELYAAGFNNRQIADTLTMLPRSTIVADSAEPKSIDELKLYKLAVMPSPKGKGSVNAGISFIQSLQLWITKRSVNTIKDFRNYMWQRDDDGKILNAPEHPFSHGPDAVRYGLTPKMVMRTVETSVEAVKKASAILDALPTRPFPAGTPGVYRKDDQRPLPGTSVVKGFPLRGNA